MQLQTDLTKSSGKKRLSLPISPSKRDDRRSGDRRLATVFNKSCDLWLRLQKQAPTRLAVMVEMDGALEIFLSTYDALDGDWPPTREQIRSRGNISRPHHIKTIDDLLKHEFVVTEDMWKANTDPGKYKSSDSIERPSTAFNGVALPSVSASIHSLRTPQPTQIPSPEVEDTVLVQTTYPTPNATIPFDSDTPESLFGSSSPVENLLAGFEEQPIVVDPARLKRPTRVESTFTPDGPRPAKRKKLSSLNG